MKTKNTLLLIFLILAAIVLSALIANMTRSVEFLEWLTWGQKIGTDGVGLNFHVIDFNLSFHMEITVLQIMLIIAALLFHRKIR